MSNNLTILVHSTTTAVPLVIEVPLLCIADIRLDARHEEIPSEAVQELRFTIGGNQSASCYRNALAQPEHEVQLALRDENTTLNFAQFLESKTQTNPRSHTEVESGRHSLRSAKQMSQAHQRLSSILCGMAPKGSQGSVDKESVFVGAQTKAAGKTTANASLKSNLAQIPKPSKTSKCNAGNATTSNAMLQGSTSLPRPLQRFKAHSKDPTHIETDSGLDTSKSDEWDVPTTPTKPSESVRIGNEPTVSKKKTHPQTAKVKSGAQKKAAKLVPEKAQHIGKVEPEKKARPQRAAAVKAKDNIHRNVSDIDEESTEKSALVPSAASFKLSKQRLKGPVNLVTDTMEDSIKPAEHKQVREFDPVDLVDHDSEGISTGRDPHLPTDGLDLAEDSIETGEIGDNGLQDIASKATIEVRKLSDGSNDFGPLRQTSDTLCEPQQLQIAKRAANNPGPGANSLSNTTANSSIREDICPQSYIAAHNFMSVKTYRPTESQTQYGRSLEDAHSHGARTQNSARKPQEHSHPQQHVGEGYQNQKENEHQKPAKRQLTPQTQKIHAGSNTKSRRPGKPDLRSGRSPVKQAADPFASRLVELSQASSNVVKLKRAPKTLKENADSIKASKHLALNDTELRSSHKHVWSPSESMGQAAARLPHAMTIQTPRAQNNKRKMIEKETGGAAESRLEGDTLRPPQNKTPTFVPRKQQIISFSKSGPRNQGTLDTARDLNVPLVPEDLVPFNAIRADAEPSERFDEGHTLLNDNEETSPTRSQKIVATSDFTLGPSQPQAPKQLDAMPLSQGSRVTAAGSPLPPRSSQQRSEPNQSSLRLQSKIFASTPGVMQVVTEKLLGPEVIATEPSHQLSLQTSQQNIMQEDEASQVAIPKFRKHILHSPNGPSEASALQAHYHDASGIMFNIKTTEMITPVNNNGNPFNDDNVGSQSTFSRMLRVTADPSRKRTLPEGPAGAAAKKNRTQQITAVREDPDQTLVNSSSNAQAPDSSQEGSDFSMITKKSAAADNVLDEEREYSEALKNASEQEPTMAASLLSATINRLLSRTVRNEEAFAGLIDLYKDRGETVIAQFGTAIDKKARSRLDAMKDTREELVRDFQNIATQLTAEGEIITDHTRAMVDSSQVSQDKLSEMVASAFAACREQEPQ